MNLRRGLWYSSAVLALLWSGSALAASPEAGDDANARVSTVEGTLFGRGPYDTDTSELAANAVLRPGDEIFTDEGTFAEVEFPGSSFLRLGSDSDVVIQKIDDGGVEIALARGVLYLSRGDNAAPMRVQTVAGAVETGGRSMIRVANDPSSSSLEVSVASGSAELRNDSRATPIAQAQSMTFGNGVRNESFDPSRGDAFDKWNLEREGKVRQTTRPPHVAENVVGSYELDGNGDWVLIDGYWAWRPTATVGWRPYSDGYWAWVQPYGWSWVDYQPWGYTTCHYGRWYYRNTYGWVWYPDAAWGVSWVVWAAFGDNLGWAPCDFWGRPIYCYSYYSYYDYGAWSYASCDYFYYGGGYHWYYDGDDYYYRHHPSNGHVYHGDGHVATSTHHEAVGGSVASHKAVGMGGKYGIHTFTADSIKQFTPVAVRDPVRDLTPKTIVAAADSGRIKGFDKGGRNGEFLSKAVENHGVKAEPWNGSGRAGAIGGGRDEAKGGDASLGGGRDNRNTDAGRFGSDPGRRNEGWLPKGDAGKGSDRNANVPSMRGNDGNDAGSFGGRSRGNDQPATGNDRGSGWNRNDGATPQPSDRGNQPDRSGQGWQTPSDRGNQDRGNDGFQGSHGRDSQPVNNEPSYREPPRNNEPAYQPRNDPPAQKQEPVHNEPSRTPPSQTPPKADPPAKTNPPSDGHKRGDAGRSSWYQASNGGYADQAPAASNDRGSSWGSSRGASWGSSSGSSRPSDSGRSSWSGGSPSYSAPSSSGSSYSGGSRGGSSGGSFGGSSHSSGGSSSGSSHSSSGSSSHSSGGKSASHSSSGGHHK